MNEQNPTTCYGWASFYPHQVDPYPTFPMVGYFLETEVSMSGDWPLERCKSLLSFWLGREAIPECLQ